MCDSGSESYGTANDKHLPQSERAIQQPTPAKSSPLHKDRVVHEPGCNNGESHLDKQDRQSEVMGRSFVTAIDSANGFNLNTRPFDAQRMRHKSVPTQFLSANKTPLAEGSITFDQRPVSDRAPRKASNNTNIERKLKRKIKRLSIRTSDIERRIHSIDRIRDGPVETVAAPRNDVVQGGDNVPASPAPPTPAAPAAPAAPSAPPAPPVAGNTSARQSRNKISVAEKKKIKPELSKDVPDHLRLSHAGIKEVGKVINHYERHRRAPYAFTWHGCLRAEYKSLLDQRGSALPIWTSDEIARIRG